MKIALCLFGNMRTFDVCAPSLVRHVLKNNDCDIFIHTWDTLNHKTQTWHDNVAFRTNTSTKTVRDKILQWYSPVRMIIESQEIVDMGNIVSANRQISIFGINAMVYSMEQANILRQRYESELGIKYDYVLFTRPDVFFKSDLLISEIQSEFTDCNLDESLLCACHPIGRVLTLERTNCYDLIFLARPSVIDNFFKNKKQFLDLFTPGALYHLGPEYYFVQTFAKLQYDIVLLNFIYDRDFKIVRLERKRERRKNILKKIIRKIRDAICFGH